MRSNISASSGPVIRPSEGTMTSRVVDSVPDGVGFGSNIAIVTDSHNHCSFRSLCPQPPMLRDLVIRPSRHNLLLALDSNFFTYGHSQLKTGHPVRSAIHKQLNGRLVLRWVTTWESLLLYVLLFALSSSSLGFTVSSS